MTVLNIRTILIGSLATNLLCALVVLILWLQNRWRIAGIHYWALSFFSQAVGLVLILFRSQLPPFFPLTLANTFLLVGALLALWGVKDFAGRPNRWGGEAIILAVFFLLLAYYSLPVPNLRGRVIILSAGVFFYTFRGVRLIFQRLPGETGRDLRGLGLVFLLFAVGALLRIGYFLIASPPEGDLFQGGDGEALFMLAYQLLLILLAYTMILTVNHRLLRNFRLEEEKFSKAFRSSPYALMLTRLADGRIQEVNDGFVRLSGYSREEALGKTTQELRLWAREEDRSILTEALTREGRMEPREFVFRVKSGALLIGMVSAETLRINDEPFILSSVRDITARKKAEEALKESEERYRKLVENANEAIMVAQEGRIRFNNRRTEEMIGYSERELQSREFTDFIHPEDRSMVMERHLARLKGEEVPTIYTFRVITKTGEVRWVEINSVLMIWEGRPASLFFLNDITERKAIEDHIQKMTIHDELTGLYNRRGFIALAEQQFKIEERRKQKLVLYFADLDQMKWINDQLGHLQGDRALQDASRILKETFREADIIGRMGGDEFAVLALDMDGVEPDLLIDRLEKALQAFRQGEERPYRLSISMGFAEYDPSRPISLDQLFAEADQRMYEEKRKKNKTGSGQAA